MPFSRRRGGERDQKIARELTKKVECVSLSLSQQRRSLFFRKSFDLLALSSEFHFSQGARSSGVETQIDELSFILPLALPKKYTLPLNRTGLFFRTCTERPALLSRTVREEGKRVQLRGLEAPFFF